MLYGIIDMMLCYFNNNVGDKYFVELIDGYFSGLCWGMCGNENFGSGWFVFFMLESGFDLSIGVFV